MTIEARLPDGRVLRFPDGTDQQVIQNAVRQQLGQQESIRVSEGDPGLQQTAVDTLQQQPAQQQQPIVDPTQVDQRGFLERQGFDRPPNLADVRGGIEGFLSLGSQLLGETVGGVAGALGALDPFAPEGQGVRNLDFVRNLISFEPETEQGRGAIANIAEPLQPLAEKLQKVRAFLGDDAFEATGSPALAAIVTALPDALLETVGAGTGRRLGTQTATQTARQQASREAVRRVEDVEQATGIRQLTTDVRPPETRTARFIQQQGEFVNPAQRAAQQQERIQAVDNLFTEFDVADGARFESTIVEGVRESISAQKRAAGIEFDAVVNQLNQVGPVAIQRTKQFAQKILDEELAKGTLADKSIVKQMEDFISAPDDLAFESVKSIRSAVGNNLQKARALSPVVGTSDTGQLSQLYKNLTEDMTAFAREVGGDIARQWRQADKDFSDFATGVNKAGARALIKRGDATPEVVDQLLFSTKNSDVEFLARNIDDAGRNAAKQRILQKFLEKASPDGESINPNIFATQVSKFRNQVGKFFDPSERKAIMGLRDALNQTRRAQDAAVATATGQQLVPLFALTNPVVLVPGVAQAMIERPVLRNLLIRRNAAKTARQRFNIDQQLQAEIDRLGLGTAATTGAVTVQEEQ